MRHSLATGHLEEYDSRSRLAQHDCVHDASAVDTAADAGGGLVEAAKQLDCSCAAATGGACNCAPNGNGADAAAGPG